MPALSLPPWPTPDFPHAPLCAHMYRQWVPMGPGKSMRMPCPDPTCPSTVPLAPGEPAEVATVLLLMPVSLGDGRFNARPVRYQRVQDNPFGGPDRWRWVTLETLPDVALPLPR